MENVLNELQHEGGAEKLKHVENVADKSQPRIEPGTQIRHWDKTGFLKEIEGGHDLKHVADVADRSSPRVEAVKLHPSERPALLSEVKAVGGHHAVVSELKAASQAGGVPLTHVEAPADRSAPTVEGAQVRKWDKDAFLHEIESPKPLKHVEGAEVKDRSSPVVQSDVQLKPNKHGELMSEIKTSSPKTLRHVTETADRSEPKVTKTAALHVHGGGA